MNTPQKVSVARLVQEMKLVDREDDITRLSKELAALFSLAIAGERLPIFKNTSRHFNAHATLSAMTSQYSNIKAEMEDMNIKLSDLSSADQTEMFDHMIDIWKMRAVERYVESKKSSYGKDPSVITKKEAKAFLQEMSAKNEWFDETIIPFVQKQTAEKEAKKSPLSAIIVEPQKMAHIQTPETENLPRPSSNIATVLESFLPKKLRTALP